MSVDEQSALREKFEITAVPSLIAAKIAARCEIDLSPGRAAFPLRYIAKKFDKTPITTLSVLTQSVANY